MKNTPIVASNDDTSQVWLVSQDASKLGNSNRKIAKSKLFDYPKDTERNDWELMLPVGYIIRHPEGKSSSFEDYGGGFIAENNLVVRPIMDTVDISHLEGELLTIIDASFADKSQCEAMKSLVRNTLWTFNQRAERKLTEMFKRA